MDISTSEPFGPRAEHFDAATSPSYHDRALYTAVPDTKEEWEGLLRNNTSCLKGIAFSQQTGLPEMAQYTAFEFHYNPLKGPEYVQGEETDFKVLKIESEFQQQGVHIGVSQQDIEVLMKNLALENRLEFQKHDRSLHQKKGTAKIKKLEISHRHPKFVLFLDQRSLAITADCRERLQRLRNTHDRGEIIAFLEDYGAVSSFNGVLKVFIDFLGEGFATQVTVGGRLFHSENASMLEDKALEERINSLRVAAKASLPSINSFSKAGSVSNEAGMVHTEHSQSKSVSSGMIWCGVGGDPCLHGDPGAWMHSMKEDKSRWKIIEKSRVKTLPVILGKFNGFEWVPQKFQELLKPALPSVPRLALANDFHIGLPSIAISSAWSLADDEGRETLLSGFVFLQDEMGFIKYGYIRMKVSDMKPDILFVDSTVRARHSSPLYIGESLDSISILNVTEEGFLADLKLDDTGGLDYGSLVDLQLQVAPHSNIACTSDPGHCFICFEDLNGDLCLVSMENGVEYMDHGQNLNILPGTALAICSWKSHTGSMGWRSTYHHLAIGFQDRSGRLMSLERQTGETHATQWNLSEIVAPSVLEGFTFKPWKRSNCLFSLRPISPPHIEYAFYPDSYNRLIYHACDKSGRLVKHSNPVCTIWGNSRYAYMDQALVYMSANGQLECTSLCENPELFKNRPIFQPRCRKRCQAQLRWTLERDRNS